ncbi:MAG: 23S rRNA (pseudouridine(1915)-N(3))-methyltransferase RlmH [Rubrivivax sp.]|nr:23S rRNA (pseudouridine(1915)-N(3))-methyltransferase RlmH [Rubrivivax sp.]
MRLLVLAIGHRQPEWAEAAWADFARRFPATMRLELQALKAEPRATGRTPAQCMAAEAARIEAALAGLARQGTRQGQAARRIVLDERGTAVTSPQLAARLRAWRDDGRDAAFLIGGPDGLDESLRRRADETLRLSDLTLPHALARVLLAEALYRAMTLLEGHPYHRE